MSELQQNWMDCGKCGAACIQSDKYGGFYDGQEATCEECGALNTVSADEDEAYPGRWWCKHGADDATPCAACDAEDEAVLAEGPAGGGT